MHQLQFSGSPRQIGEAHGETLREKIVQLYEIRLDLLLRGARAPLADLREAATSLWGATLAIDKGLADELIATSRAAGVDGWQLIVAGGYTDLADVLRLERPDVRGFDCDECAVEAIPKMGALVGTWDSHPEAEEYMVVLTRKPTGACSVATVSLTTAGWPVQFGQNSCGVAFAITNLTPTSASRQGAAYIGLIGAAARSRSARGGAALIARSPAAGGHSYVFLDQQTALIIEKSPNGFSERASSSHALCQTNHYTSSLDDNSGYAFEHGSRRRWHELSTAPRSAVSTPQAFRTWLQGSKYVIRQPGEAARTCAAFYIAKEGIWALEGKAIEDDMRLYPAPVS